jgi:hypothetical protein
VTALLVERGSRLSPPPAACRTRQAVKIAVSADAANLRGDRVKFGAVEERLCDILSGGASMSQVPDTVGRGGGGRAGQMGAPPAATGCAWQSCHLPCTHPVTPYRMLQSEHAAAAVPPLPSPRAAQQAEEMLLQPARARVVLRERRKRGRHAVTSYYLVFDNHPEAEGAWWVVRRRRWWAGAGGGSRMMWGWEGGAFQRRSGRVFVAAGLLGANGFVGWGKGAMHLGFRAALGGEAGERGRTRCLPPGKRPGWGVWRSARWPLAQSRPLHPAAG